MVFYFVQRGETLYAIAKRYQTTVHAIVAANRLDDPNEISPGQALIIPRPGEVPSPPPGGIVHLVRPGETIFQLAERFGSSPAEILKANQIAHPEFILPGQQLVIPEQVTAGEDWPLYGRTPGRVGSGPVMLSGRPVEAWSYTPRRTAGIRPSAPVIRYDRVYVGLGDGQFYSIDRHTGRAKWRFALGGGASAPAPGDHRLPAPAVFDGLTYLCSAEGLVTAIDAHTGKPVWRIRTEGPVTSSPAVWNGVVYLACRQEHVYALEAKTGAIAWKTKLDSAIVHPVALTDGKVLVVTHKGMLWSLDAESGEALWKAPADPGNRPVWAEVLILVGGRAYDPATGEALWAVDAGGADAVVCDDQVVYPGGTVDLFTGALTSPVANPAGGDGHVPRPEHPVDHHIVTGEMLLGVHANQLHAWHLPTWNRLWSLELPATISHPPAVARGQLLLTLDDGSVCAYRFANGRHAS